jgi:ribosomal 50S subunit-recycling heat shock protein
MVFESQTPNGRFVAWGEKKAKENSFIVKEKGKLTGKVIKIKDSPKFGKIFELEVKNEKTPLVVLGSTILNREMGYDYEIDSEGNKVLVASKTSKPVVVGDTIRITFNGMLKMGKGKNDAYDLKVEVDR